MTDRLGRLEVASMRPLTQKHQGFEQKEQFQKFITTGEWEEKALSSVDEDGGFLIPQTISDDIANTAGYESVMRKLSSTVTISSDCLDLLVSQEGTDAGWAAESDERVETSSPKLNKIKIPVHELYAKPRATQKLLDDAKLNIEEWLMQQVANKMASLENYAFIRGNGEKQPRGFLSYPLSFGESEWGKIQAFNTGVAGGFSEDNPLEILIDTVNSLKSQYLSGAKWIISRSAAAAICKLRDKNGLPLWNSDLNVKACDTLFGYPVVICDDMPAINNTDDMPAIAFGNFFEGYKIVERQGTKIMRDPYSAKPYVEFYTTKRVGGDVVNFDSIKVITFTQA